MRMTTKVHERRTGPHANPLPRRDRSETCKWQTALRAAAEYERSKPVAATDDLSSQQLYHGTRADLKPGDLIQPGHTSNYGKRKKRPMST